MEEMNLVIKKVKDKKWKQGVLRPAAKAAEASASWPSELAMQPDPNSLMLPAVSQVVAERSVAAARAGTLAIQVQGLLQWQQLPVSSFRRESQIQEGIRQN